MNHEAELIKEVFLASKRQRCLDFIASPKTGQKLLQELVHFKQIDPRCAKEAHLSPSRLASSLRALNVPDCGWVVSENSEIDGRLLLVSEALQGATWVLSSHSCPGSWHISRMKIAPGFYSAHSDRGVMIK